MAVPSLCGRY